MAKINKVELNLGQKIANPFKTTRKSDTNPFKYSNFEGNTLQFADVFEGFEPKKINKMKMIASSVMGSLTKFRNTITEPIVNFVLRVKDGITSAWTYAKNTNVEIAGLKGITENISSVMNYDVGQGLKNSISGIGKNLTERLSLLNKDMTELGHGLSEKWTSLIGNINLNGIGKTKISSDLPVAELRTLWINENELLAAKQGAKEIALDSANNMEVKVA